ncbi:MAG: hypothetical protein E6J51_11995, partial [Chloroflexi bacterium]
MRTTVRKTGVAILVVALMTLPAAVMTAPARAAGGLGFGAPFMLNNPQNPFVFGVQDVEPSIRVDTLG